VGAEKLPALVDGEWGQEEEATGVSGGLGGSIVFTDSEPDKIKGNWGGARDTSKAGSILSGGLFNIDSARSPWSKVQGEKVFGFRLMCSENPKIIGLPEKDRGD